MIDYINFNTILPIWQSKLWPNRTSSIESHSAMMITPGTYDTGNFLLPLWCYGFFDGNQLIGVNSSHLCTDGLLRIRGFWVDSAYRKQGIGRTILEKAVQDAKKNRIEGVWAFPRITSWSIFEKIGFIRTSEWMLSETSDANCFCKLEL